MSWKTFRRDNPEKLENVVKDLENKLFAIALDIYILSQSVNEAYAVIQDVTLDAREYFLKRSKVGG